MIRWLLETQCLNNDWSASAVQCFSISFWVIRYHIMLIRLYADKKNCVHGEMQKGHTVRNLTNTKIEMQCHLCPTNANQPGAARDKCRNEVDAALIGPSC